MNFEKASTRCSSVIALAPSSGLAVFRTADIRVIGTLGKDDHDNMEIEPGWYKAGEELRREDDTTDSKVEWPRSK